MRLFLNLLIGISLAGLLAGCPTSSSDDDDSATDDDDSAGDDDDAVDDDDTGPIEVEGVWFDGWDFQIIDDATWTLGAPPAQSDHLISDYSNADDWAVAQNAPDHPWNPDLWSLFEWTWFGDAWWICQTAFDAASEEEALAADPADPAAPDTDGCGGFPWSTLVASQGPVAIIGDWLDDWGFDHAIRQDSWTMDPNGTPSVVWFTQYDNDAGWIVGQNDGVDSWNPDLWSRYDYILEADSVRFCQITFDAADEATALADESADREDMDAGCAGFAWSLLTLAP